MGFVVASGLAMACLIFAALSMGNSHHPHDTSVSAETTSTATVTLADPVPRVPATLTMPGSRPRAVKPTTTKPTTTSATPTTTTSTTSPGAPPATPGMVNSNANQHSTAPAPAPVAAGDCVSASGAVADCGSGDSAYRVNSTVGGGGSCPSDSDRSMTQALPGGAKKLCMDTDWEVGRCMSMSGGSATPVDCSASAPGVVRVQSINHGTSDVNTCTDANHGVVYQQRHFVVCVAQK